MNYFEQDMDGSMEPDEDGSWVKSEQADELYMALLGKPFGVFFYKFLLISFRISKSRQRGFGIQTLKNPEFAIQLQF